MLKKLKTQLVVTLALVALIIPGVVGVASVGAALDCANVSQQLTAGANSTDSGISTQCKKNSGVDESSITKIAKTVTNILSLVIGAISVIMIIFGGFRYVTSGGVAEKVGGAKNTVIYALIGLVVVVLAQLIVHFVLNKATSVLPG